MKDYEIEELYKEILKDDKKVHQLVVGDGEGDWVCEHCGIVFRKRTDAIIHERYICIFRVGDTCEK